MRGATRCATRKPTTVNTTTTTRPITGRQPGLGAKLAAAPGRPMPTATPAMMKAQVISGRNSPLSRPCRRASTRMITQAMSM